MAKKRARLAEPWVYVLRRDRQLPPEEQSKFTLRPLTISERAVAGSGLVSLVAFADGTRETHRRETIVSLNLALQNIVAVENFPSDKPEMWPDGREARLRYLEQLDDEDVFELGNEIYVRSTVGEAEKNS